MNPFHHKKRAARESLPVSRRRFLQSGLALGSMAALSPNVWLRSALASAAGPPRNLVVIELFGGNDGLNMIVPYGVNGGTYYSEFRGSIAIPEPQVLKVPASNVVGFHPSLEKLKDHFLAGRLAVAQGVGYPQPSFSHEFAQQIWAKGDPTGAAASSWLARMVDLHPASFPVAADLFDHLTPALQGATELVPALESASGFDFPYDEWYPGDADNLRATYETIVAGTGAMGGSLGAVSGTSTEMLSLVDAFAGIPEPALVGSYPNAYFSSALQLALQLLSSGLGTRIVHLGYGGFDTHSDQNIDGYHANLLQTLSEGLDAFHTDLTALGLADSTLVVVYSEFGRTVYENGSRGTDHGTVAPVLIFGNSVLGGFVTSHPTMDPTMLSPEGELPMTTDFRDVFGTIVSRWLQEDPAIAFPGQSLNDLGFLA